MKVALFIPCLSEHLYPESALNMVKVLEKAGAEIEYVEGQTCCGQIEFNSGYRQEVVPVAERFLQLFADKECIVSPSGSCVAMVRKFYYDLELHAEFVPLREKLSPRIFEFSEFLVKFNLLEKLAGGSFPHKVTYHDSCHLNRELGIHAQPRQLIGNIPDIDFVEMQHSDICCGFGGTFSYKFPELSTEMVARKCQYIQESEAEFCIGCDESCLMNIEGYLRKNKMRAKTMHLATLLATSLNL